jgi:hypothetical protein
VCKVFTLSCVFVIITSRKVLVETFFGEILSEKKKWVATSTHEILGEKSSKLAKFQKKRKSLPYFRL